MNYQELKDILEKAEQSEHQSDFDRCESLCKSLLAEQHSDSIDSMQLTRIHCRACELLAIVHGLRDNFILASSYCERGIELAESIKDQQLLVRILVREAWGCRETQQYDQAETLLRRSLKISEETGFQWRIARSYVIQSNILRRKGFSEEANELLSKGLALLQEIGDEFWTSDVYSSMAFDYQSMGKLEEAIEYGSKALAIAEPRKFRRIIGGTNQAIGNVYLELGETRLALQYFNAALKVHEEIGRVAQIAADLDSIGRVYLQLGEYTQSLEYFHKALAFGEKANHRDNISVITANLANTYLEIGEYDSSLEYSSRALLMSIEGGNTKFEAINLCNIGIAYSKNSCSTYNPTLAEEYFMKSVDMLSQSGNNSILYQVFLEITNFYAQHQRWEEAYKYKTLFHEVKDEVLNRGAQKRAQSLETERKLSEERARTQEREKILSNILPEEITSRLIKGENPIADHFECVSILFMDIADFTPLASTITAQQLVYLLNAIFSAADSVMREFGLEKIKTIGDAYMAVAGAPVVKKDHARRAADAALKLLDVMQNLVVTFPENLGDKLWIESIPEINVRIGLHCGPAAAGVVGENKFLYDLWGDTVNTASRMESHGEAGRIHISNDFVEALLNCHSESADEPVRVTARGEIEIKGKGKMKTYFLEATK